MLSNLLQYGPYALLGLLISILADLYSSGIKPSQFQFKKWADDNGFRLLLSVVLIAAAVLLGNNVSQLTLGVDITPGHVFLAAMGSDYLVSAFTKRQSKQLNVTGNSV